MLLSVYITGVVVFGFVVFLISSEGIAGWTSLEYWALPFAWPLALIFWFCIGLLRLARRADRFLTQVLR